VFQSNQEGPLDLIYVATGSEVSLCIEAAKALTSLNVRVVSMPSDGLFDAQPAEYRRSIILPRVPSISVECLAILGWERYAHAHIGMTTFGASAPIDQVMKKFGFTKDQVVERTGVLLREMTEAQKAVGATVGLLPTHYQFSKTKVQQQHVH